MASFFHDLPCKQSFYSISDTVWDIVFNKASDTKKLMNCAKQEQINCRIKALHPQPLLFNIVDCSSNQVKYAPFSTDGMKSSILSKGILCDFLQSSIETKKAFFGQEDIQSIVKKMGFEIRSQIQSRYDILCLAQNAAALLLCISKVFGFQYLDYTKAVSDIKKCITLHPEHHIVRNAKSDLERLIGLIDKKTTNSKLTIFFQNQELKEMNDGKIVLPNLKKASDFKKDSIKKLCNILHQWIYNVISMNYHIIINYHNGIHTPEDFAALIINISGNIYKNQDVFNRLQSDVLNLSNQLACIPGTYTRFQEILGSLYDDPLVEKYLATKEHYKSEFIKFRLNARENGIKNFVLDENNYDIHLNVVLDYISLSKLKIIEKTLESYDESADILYKNLEAVQARMNAIQQANNNAQQPNESFFITEMAQQVHNWFSLNTCAMDNSLHTELNSAFDHLHAKALNLRQFALDRNHSNEDIEMNAYAFLGQISSDKYTHPLFHSLIKKHDPESKILYNHLNDGDLCTKIRFNAWPHKICFEYAHLLHMRPKEATRKQIDDAAGSIQELMVLHKKIQEHPEVYRDITSNIIKNIFALNPPYSKEGVCEELIGHCFGDMPNIGMMHAIFPEIPKYEESTGLNLPEHMRTSEHREREVLHKAMRGHQPCLQISDHLRRDTQDLAEALYFSKESKNIFLQDIMRCILREINGIDIAIKNELSALNKEEKNTKYVYYILNIITEFSDHPNIKTYTAQYFLNNILNINKNTLTPENRVKIVQAIHKVIDNTDARLPNKRASNTLLKKRIDDIAKPILKNAFFNVLM